LKSENVERHKIKLLEIGFTTINEIYAETEISSIISTIEKADSTKDTFRKSTDLFAVRQFLKEIPETIEFIFNPKLKSLIAELFGHDFFVVKSIYFDKPEASNWYVSYHQDLTISVDKKLELENYGPWTVKQNQFAVQPPINILENNFTIRIHLDDTDENNGALKVIPKSHLKKVYRAETIDWTKESESNCNVKRGGVMIMKPLLLHSSSRTTNHKKRRVVHIEFSNQELPLGLNWSEKMNF
jgi:ectoine hydroxylase-related dioxygenase (phytanoyl-CoA dioxygenase family)